MRQVETTPKTPVEFKRSRRMDNARVLTSMDAGESMPIRFSPVLREDSGSGTIQATIMMNETPETVLNGIQAKMLTYFVPFLAFEQFKGSIEEMNRCYEGAPSLFGDGTQVAPFFNKNLFYDLDSKQVTTYNPASPNATALSNGVIDFYRASGIHTSDGDVNSSYVQAYNILHNYRRKSRSPQLAERNQYQHDFAECFWPTAGMSPIVAAYDSKLISGEVSLQGLSFQAPITAPLAGNSGIDGSNGTGNALRMGPETGDWNWDGVKYVFNDIVAELSNGGGATVNLADIDQARKTAAFARLRSMYSGNKDYAEDDSTLIDLLMQGIRIPVEMLKDPILVGRSEGMFSMAERFATDAANLDAHVTQGMVRLSHRVNLPATNTGGILVTVVEIAPERLFERTKEHFLNGVTSAEQLPNALVDYLDPEKVEVVHKDHLDVLHSSPSAILGYQPKNSNWNRNDVRVGGKFFRPYSDSTYVQDRARIWSNEVVDPELSTDFYLTTSVNKKVFSDQNVDSFEVMLQQNMVFTGLTQFGDQLLETDGSSDYDYITNQVDTDQGEA